MKKNSVLDDNLLFNVLIESIFNSPTIADAINEEIGTLTDELTLKSQTVVELTEEMVR